MHGRRGAAQRRAAPGDRQEAAYGSRLRFDAAGRSRWRPLSRGADAPWVRPPTWKASTAALGRRAAAAAGHRRAASRLATRSLSSRGGFRSTRSRASAAARTTPDRGTRPSRRRRCGCRRNARSRRSCGILSTIPLRHGVPAHAPLPRVRKRGAGGPSAWSVRERGSRCCCRATRTARPGCRALAARRSRRGRHGGKRWR